MQEIYTKLVSHKITDLSSEENIRRLNTLLDEQLTAQGDMGEEGKGRGRERKDGEGKEGQGCDLEWIRTTRQIMLDIGELLYYKKKTVPS